MSQNTEEKDYAKCCLRSIMLESQYALYMKD